MNGTTCMNDGGPTKLRHRRSRTSSRSSCAAYSLRQDSRCPASSATAPAPKSRHLAPINYITRSDRVVNRLSAMLISAAICAAGSASLTGLALILHQRVVRSGKPGRSVALAVLSAKALAVGLVAAE